MQLDEALGSDDDSDNQSQSTSDSKADKFKLEGKTVSARLALAEQKEANQKLKKEIRRLNRLLEDHDIGGRTQGHPHVTSDARGCQPRNLEHRKLFCMLLKNGFLVIKHGRKGPPHRTRLYLQGANGMYTHIETCSSVI